jgi:DNA topoisomerase IB
MFRTWNANIILLENILAFPIPEDPKEATSNLKEIIEKAAAQLHHTKSVSKASYMNNKIIDLYENDLDQFKRIFKNIKKKYKGKLPKINILLTELFINLTK